MGEDLIPEEFWVDFKEILFTEDRVEDAEEEVEKILGFAEIEEGKILDMPCGVGRHSILLGEKGFEVIGVDKTSVYLEEAREKNDQENVEFLEADMRDFRRESEFDAVIHWWNSFGYFETREDNLEVLENMKASLKQGGVLVMDIWSKELFAQKGLDKRWSEPDQDTFLLEEHEVKDDWNKVESTWIRATEEGLNKVEWSKKIYSAKELEDMLEEAGFSEIEFYGTLEEDPYNFEAERLFVKAFN